ncbi:MAG TPA: hypothetical protein VGI24_04810 [Solirubrobacteraceae bacterium]|jgi:hypothetical protein
MSRRDDPLDPLDPRELGERAYDPELPFLVDLEREVRREAQRVADVRSRAGREHERRGRAGGETPAPASIPRRVRGHTDAEPSRAPTTAYTARDGRSRRGSQSQRASARVARRSVTLIALLCLIAASAYGAHRVLSPGAGDGPNPAYVSQGAFVLAARSGAGEESWSLRLYRRGNELCRVLAVAQSEASRCTPAPGPRTLTMTSVSSPHTRYLFGVAGTQVAQVSVHAGKATRTVPTRTPDLAQIRAGELPAHTRYFVAALTRPAGTPDPPARVLGLNAAGHPVGAAQIDCGQSTDPRRCSLTR